MNKFKKKKNENKEYNYKYIIYWKNGGETIGEVTNCSFNPAEFLLNDKLTFFKNKAFYYNSNDIRMIVINDFEELEKGDSNEKI